MSCLRLHLICFLLILPLAACLNAQAPAPVSLYAMGSGAGSTGIHTVSSGETLWLISKRYNIAARDIAVSNHLAPPFYLAPGTRLKLPPPQEYRARAGDSLNTVSRLFGVNRSEIAEMNYLSPPYTLTAGQNLRLPSVTQKSEPQVFASKVAAAPLQSVTSETLAPPISAVKTESKAAHTLQLPKGYGEKKSPAAEVAEEAKEEKPVQMVSAAAEQPSPKSLSTAEIPKRSSKKFLRPVRGQIISGYGPKQNGLFNDGINIAAPRDLPVRAAENGVVVYAGNELKGSGNLVLIKHADRWMTAYAHLGNIQIKRGDVVKRGQTIGTVGSTGSVDRPQLHFEVRRGTDALNPEVYLES